MTGPTSSGSAHAHSFLLLCMCDGGCLVATASAYLGLDSQDDLRQGHDEALEGDSDVLQYKVCDPHDPQQVEEVQGLQVGLQKYEAVGRIQRVRMLTYGHGPSAAPSTHSGNLINMTNRKGTELGIRHLCPVPESARNLLCDLRWVT